MTASTRTAAVVAGRVRTVAGLLLVVLSALLAPLAAVAGWAQTLVGDTDTFVATYGPVVRSPAMQQLVATRLTAAVVEQVGLGDNPLITGVVGRVVDELTSSEAYSAAATASLRITHAELVALLAGDPGTLQVTDGEVTLRLAPFAEAVKSRLSEAGVPFVDRLPEVKGGITLLHIDPALLPALRTAYGTLALVSAWLPWLALALAVGGVLLHPRTRHALIGLGLAVPGWVIVVALAWVLAVPAVTARLGDDLAVVADLAAGRTAAPVTPALLALGAGGTLLAALAWLAVGRGGHRRPGE
jgi:hypothetical protein